jgi:hypothetical protein
VTCCKNATRVDTEHVLNLRDQLLHVVNVSLLVVGGSCARSAVVRVRLISSRRTRTLHIDGDGVRICCRIIEPSLRLNGFSRCPISMECKDDRRGLVDIVKPRNVNQETPGNPIRWSHVESRTRPIGSKICRQRYATASACSCDRGSVV